MADSDDIQASTREWLKTVDIDLRSADSDIAQAPPILEGVVFHSQQAVEKVLKAFLTWHDQTFSKTHDIGEVGKQCVALDESLRPLVRQATPLTKYAWRFRYPGEPVEPTEDEAQRALAIARQVVAAVRSRIPLPPESAG